MKNSSKSKKNFVVEYIYAFPDEISEFESVCCLVTHILYLNIGAVAAAARGNDGLPAYIMWW